MPIRHLAGGSEILLVDKFHIGQDEHYRLIHLPDGKPPVPDNTDNGDGQPDNGDGQLVFKPQQPAAGATFVAVADTKHVNETLAANVRKDAQALRGVTEDSSAFAEIASELNQYLLECGGFRAKDALKQQCWNHIKVAAPSANGMVPEQGAVWRELVRFPWLRPCAHGILSVSIPAMLCPLLVYIDEHVDRDFVPGVAGRVGWGVPVQINAGGFASLEHVLVHVHPGPALLAALLCVRARRWYPQSKDATP